MVKAKDEAPQTFVKKLPNGTVLERTVTSAPSSEVEARFDGFFPRAGRPASTTSTSSTPSSSSS